MARKNRDTIFVVQRTGGEAVPALCEAYLSLEGAEQAAGRMNQRMLDMGFEGFKYEVKTVTYYDE